MGFSHFVISRISSLKALHMKQNSIKMERRPLKESGTKTPWGYYNNCQIMLYRAGRSKVTVLFRRNVAM